MIGGEHSEEFYHNPVKDVGKRKYIDPRRSDVV